MAVYTVTTQNTRALDEPFQVIVQDERDHQVVEMGAMSRDHASMIAGSLVLLLPKLDPGMSVVLDASLAGRGWSDQAIARA